MSDWTEPTTQARGAVVIVGGRGETSAVYGRLSRRLAVDGYRSTVVAAVLDVAAGVERGEDEIEAVVRAAVTAAAGATPVVVIGSDIGATVAARVAADAPAGLSGVVLAGLPTADAGAAGDWDDEIEARSACPIHRGVLAAEGAVAPGRLDAPAAVATAETLAGIELPSLAIHGEIDVISPVDTALVAYRTLPRGAAVVVTGGRHDILNDVTHRSVAAEIVQFLERLRIPGSPLILRREPAREDALTR